MTRTHTESSRSTPETERKKESQSKLFQRGENEVILGDLNNESAIRETIKGCEAVIYNVGIIREFPSKGITFENLHFEGAKRCIDIAKDEQVRRFILMSANGVKKNGTGYQKTKILATMGSRMREWGRGTLHSCQNIVFFVFGTVLGFWHFWICFIGCIGILQGFLLD